MSLPKSVLFGCSLPLAALAPIAATASGTEQRMNEVVVTGTKTPHALKDVPVETTVITREEIDRLPAQNVTDLLKTVPGISTSLLDDAIGSDNLRSTFRGLQFNEGYALILVDGQRVHGGLGAHGDYGVSLTQIPVSMIERIEIVKGASSSLYGADALAGVVNIITRKVPTEASGSAGVKHGRYDMLPRDNNTSLIDDSRRLSSHYASYGDKVGEHSGYYLHFSSETDEDVRSSPHFTQRDALLGKWHSQLNQSVGLDLGLELSQARREAYGQNVSYDRKFDNQRLSGGLNWQQDRHAVTVKSYLYDQDFIQGFEGFEHGYRYGEIGYRQAETIYNFHGDQHLITLGAETLKQDLDYTFKNYRNNALEATVPVVKTITTNSLYLQDEILLMNEKLRLVPGVRYEDHSTFGSEVNPKFSAMYVVGDDTTLRASVGSAFKSPTIRQLYYQGIYRHGDTYNESNPNLNPETAVSWNAHLEHRMLDNRMELGVGLFRNDIEDMVVMFDTGRVTTDNTPIMSYHNISEAQMQGLELTLRADATEAMSIQSGISVTDAENKASGKDLPYVPGITASVAPTYVHHQSGVGVSGVLNWFDEQYRNSSNTQLIDAYTTLDIKTWKQLSNAARLSLEVKNLNESDKGDSAYNWRTGRSFSLALDMEF